MITPFSDRGYTDGDAFQNDAYHQGYDQDTAGALGPNDVTIQQPPAYGVAPAGAMMPMGAAPVPQQQPYGVHLQQNIVITNQLQVPRWGFMQFLDSMQHVKLTEKKQCCRGIVPSVKCAVGRCNVRTTGLHIRTTSIYFVV